MNGVEILTSAQVATEFAFNWTVLWIFVGIISGFVFFLSFVTTAANNLEWWIALIIWIVITCILCMLGVIAGTLDKTPTTYETQYKVTISDEVSMTEFYEHYEVIDQDGKIFTVREKTNEEH